MQLSSIKKKNIVRLGQDTQVTQATGRAWGYDKKKTLDQVDQGKRMDSIVLGGIIPTQINPSPFFCFGGIHYLTKWRMIDYFKIFSHPIKNNTIEFLEEGEQ